MVDTPTPPPRPLTINKRFDRQTLAFPADLISYPFWMTFAFYQYKRPLVGSRGPNSSVTSNGKMIAGQSFRLPLPNQMVDNQDVSYGEEDAGLTAGLAINAYQESGGGGGGALAGVAAAAVAGGLGVDRLASTKANLAAQLVGVAVNPFLTVMFKSPKFKRHTFSWRLSPTNVTETRNLNTILGILRSNQLPDMTGSAGGSLLTYPNIVQINVNNGTGNNNAFPYRFKPAVIETLSINFTPAGQPSFFGSTRAPTEIEIRLSLLEIEYYLQRDYADPSTGGLSFAILGEGAEFLQDVKKKAEEAGQGAGNFLDRLGRLF